MNSRAVIERLVREHRQRLLVLLVLLALNVVAGAFVVRPLGERVANVEQRGRAADATLAAARQEHAQATSALTGKDRAGNELTLFYRDVLPANLTAARKLTYPRLEQMATKAGLAVRNYRFETIAVKDSVLTRAKVEMALTGTYEAMRSFVHAIESAPEFVVIDDIGLAEGADAARDLSLALELSTYFRSDAR